MDQVCNDPEANPDTFGLTHQRTRFAEGWFSPPVLTLHLRR